MFDLCICTHNPRLPVLRRCLEAIDAQVAAVPFQVLLVDNASQPPLSGALLDGLRQHKIPATLIREQRLGLTAARLAAFQHSSGEWLIFIDDDNVIAPDFLQVGAEFARTHPEVGAFGGRISLAPEIKVPRWMAPLLGSMGIKEEGDEILINSTIEWGRHDPPGAGLWVRQALLERFADRTRANPAVFDLGRRGTELASCEDAVIVKGARELSFDNAYVPELHLVHYLKPDRFTFRHAIRSLIAYGRSIALYEQIMMLRGDQLGKLDKLRPLLSGWVTFKRERHRSIRYAAVQAAYRWSYERSRRSLERDYPELDPNSEALRNLLPFLRTGSNAHADRDAIAVTEGNEEFVIYGPYWLLPAGDYEMRAVIGPHQQTCDSPPIITAQVTVECGMRLLAQNQWRLCQHTTPEATIEFRLPFKLANDLPRTARTIETRMFTSGNASFRILSLSIIVKS